MATGNGIMRSVMAMFMAVAVMVAITSPVVTGDEKAAELCRRLYRIPVNVSGTYFLSNNCQLQCSFVDGRLPVKTPVNDGEMCLPGQNNPMYVCQMGRCDLKPGIPVSTPSPPVIHMPVTVGPRPPLPPVSRLGRLTFGPTSADLATTALARYSQPLFLLTCVRNDTIDRMPLPEEDWHNRCHSCSSPVVPRTHRPHWTTPCPQPERHPVWNRSRIIMEIWTYDTTRGRAGSFLGGINIPITDIIRRGDLGRQLSLLLADGPVSGTLHTEIDLNY